MIDYRRQQHLKEGEEGEDGGGGGERQRIRQDDNTRLSKDWHQVLGNLRQRLSGGGFLSHEDDQRQLLDRQQQQVKDQTQDQTLGAHQERKHADELDVAQSLQEDRNYQHDTSLKKDKKEMNAQCNRKYDATLKIIGK